MWRTFSSAASRDATCCVAAFSAFARSASCVFNDEAASSAFCARSSAASLSKLAPCASHTGERSYMLRRGTVSKPFCHAS